MTKARYYENDVQRLETLEALIIRFEEPVINRQDTGKKKILKLYGVSWASYAHISWPVTMSTVITTLSDRKFATVCGIDELCWYRYTGICVC